MSAVKHRGGGMDGEKRGVYWEGCVCVRCLVLAVCGMSRTSRAIETFAQLRPIAALLRFEGGFCIQKPDAR